MWVGGSLVLYAFSFLREGAGVGGGDGDLVRIVGDSAMINLLQKSKEYSQCLRVFVLLGVGVVIWFGS